MKELSLNILDITMNSVKAGASLIGIELEETEKQLVITISDNGCGMKAEQLKRLRDPFFTSRTTRKVGLGIPFYVLAAEQTGGYVEISSRHESEYPETHGTEVVAVFNKESLDFTPLGDIVSTVITLVQGNERVDFEFSHKTDSGSVELKTAEMREILGDISLSEPEILHWIRDKLNEQYEEIKNKNI